MQGFSYTNPVFLYDDGIKGKCPGARSSLDTPWERARAMTMASMRGVYVRSRPWRMGSASLLTLAPTDPPPRVVPG